MSKQKIILSKVQWHHQSLWSDFKKTVIVTQLLSNLLEAICYHDVCVSDLCIQAHI